MSVLALLYKFLILHSQPKSLVDTFKKSNRFLGHRFLGKSIKVTVFDSLLKTCNQGAFLKGNE